MSMNTCNFIKKNIQHLFLKLYNFWIEGALMSSVDHYIRAYDRSQNYSSAKNTVNKWVALRFGASHISSLILSYNIESKSLQLLFSNYIDFIEHEKYLLMFSLNALLYS